MKQMKSNRKLRGFTLLESMIALVILSVGMLGIAALYVEGLRAGRTAIYRTTAITLASDMMDRIRANPQGRTDYELTAAVANCVNGTVNCSQTQLAQEDVSVWEADVAARMPAGTSADVTVATATPIAQVDTYTITISWPEPGYDENLSYTLRALL